MIKYIHYISLIIALVGCYNSTDKPILHHNLPTPTLSIEVLKKEILGTTPQQIKENTIVVGRVISSDEDDNFYRTIVVDDGTGAIEVMMGTSPLSADYPEGLIVALQLKGCYIGYQRGVAVVGTHAPDYESYDIGYFASREAIDKVVKRGDDVVIQPARHLSIPELQRRDCGRLIAIDGLHLVSTTSIDTLAGETLHDARWKGYSLFKSDAGDSIAVYTRDYARFAQQSVPTDDVQLCGILQWAPYNGQKECYQLKMRYAKDCVTH